jgi:hypothetical protein
MCLAGFVRQLAGVHLSRICEAYPKKQGASEAYPNMGASAGVTSSHAAVAASAAAVAAAT